VGDPKVVGTGNAAHTVKPENLPKLDTLVMLDHAGLSPLVEALGLERVDGAEATKAGVAPGSPRPDPKLQELVDRVIDGMADSVGQRAFALIDLTGGKARYAGNRLLASKPYFTHSMGKLMILFGAFQLRHDLQALAKDPKITDFAALKKAAADVWRAALKSKAQDLYAAPPKGEARVITLGDAGKKVPIARYNTIDLGRIFDAAAFDSGRTLTFKTDGLKYHELHYLEYYTYKIDKTDPKTLRQGQRMEAILGAKAGELVKAKAPGLKPSKRDPKRWPDAWPEFHDLRRLAFDDRMKLTIGFSSNDAPHFLVEDLSLALVQSPLLRAGLYPRTGGLWLGHPYGPGLFRTPPVPSPDTSGITGTATTLALLMASIFHGGVLDADGRTRLQRYLAKAHGLPEQPEYPKHEHPREWAEANAGNGTRSFIGGALPAAAAGEELEVHSKLGVMDERTSDVAHVRRKKGAKEWRFVLAIMDVPPGRFDDISSVARAADLAVQAVKY
jgi:hypothetical protein